MSTGFAQPCPMVRSDLAEVEAIEYEVYSFPWTRGNFADSIDSGYSAWVVRDNEKMLGYCVLMLSLDEAHLLNISVARCAQGLGVGRYLLRWVEGVSRRLGAASMLLEVRPSNELALGFYERHGFERVGVRRNYYPAARGREDAIVMRKRLQAASQVSRAAAGGQA